VAITRNTRHRTRGDRSSAPRGLVLVAAATSSVLVLGAGPAGASSGSRCVAGAVPDAQQTLVLNESTVYSAVYGSGGAIWQGDTVKVVASGLVNDGGWPTSGNWNPNGSATPAPNNATWPAPNQRKYSLVGRFGGPAFAFNFLGAASSCSTWNLATPTALELTMNDEERNNNHGQWSVTVFHWFVENG
jgi:hypothetical protein